MSVRNQREQPRIRGCFAPLNSPQDESAVADIVTSASSYRQIDLTAERTRRRFDAVRWMKRDQIKNDTSVGLLGPRNKALVIFFSQSDCAVNHGCAIRPQQIRCLR